MNTTPIITLASIRQLDLLQLLYNEVIILGAVRTEVVAGGERRVGTAEVAERAWIRTVALTDPARADLLSDLDRGEAEVIALAQELEADVVILDERLGRRHAERLGLPLTGTLGVLLKAKALGLVPTIGPLIQEVRAAGIRLSDALIQKVLALAGERPYLGGS